MATELHVEIVTPLRSAFRGEAQQVVLPSWEGEEGVLPNHDAKLALLRGGVCTVFTAEGLHRFAIGRGFAEMAGDHVTVLTDACEPSEQIDKQAAAAELRELEIKLAQADLASEAGKLLQARVETARARVEA